MKKNSVKNNRLNSQVQRDLSDIIRGMADPRISPVTTVTRVRITPDLKFAKIHISVLGPEEELERTMEGIKSASGYIRSELAHRANLRITPELTFVADRSIADGIDMISRIDSVVARDQAHHADQESPDDED